MYQEAERLEEGPAFRATTSNFLACILIVLSFVAMVLLLPQRQGGLLALSWGCLLLAAISYAVARAPGVSPLWETAKHLGVASVVIVASRLIGVWILAYIH